MSVFNQDKMTLRQFGSWEQVLTTRNAQQKLQSTMGNGSLHLHVSWRPSKKTLFWPKKTPCIRNVCQKSDKPDMNLKYNYNSKLEKNSSILIGQLQLTIYNFESKILDREEGSWRGIQIPFSRRCLLRNPIPLTKYIEIPVAIFKKNFPFPLALKKSHSQCYKRYENPNSQHWKWANPSSHFTLSGPSKKLVK